MFSKSNNIIFFISFLISIKITNQIPQSNILVFPGKKGRSGSAGSNYFASRGQDGKNGESIIITNSIRCQCSSDKRNSLDQRTWSKSVTLNGKSSCLCTAQNQDPETKTLSQKLAKKNSILEKMNQRFESAWGIDDFQKDEESTLDKKQSDFFGMNFGTRLDDSFWNFDNKNETKNLFENFWMGDNLKGIKTQIRKTEESLRQTIKECACKQGGRSHCCCQLTCGNQCGWFVQCGKGCGCPKVLKN